MTVAIRCVNCGATYQLSEDSLGRKVRCKECGATFAAQASASETKRPGAVADTTPSPRRSMDSSLPQQIGRFEIRSKLGAGAFGTVYRAYDPILEREVALKVPNPGLLTDEKDKQRYLREPKAAAQLHHPNIVPVFEANLDGDNFFIASAYIEGQTMEKAFEEKRPDLRSAATLVMKLAGALRYAHEHKIVHRDVKPANIMLDANGEPLLMDFGLARIQESAEKLTHDGAVMGTPAYMAPEQAAGKQADVGPASDQYSLGVVLFELLCGKRPFSGPPSLVMSLVIKQEPPAPRTINPEVPLDLETICLKSMAKEPEKRYVSCQELGEDLRRWQEGLPILARRIGSIERFTRWAKREPAVAGLLTAVIILFVSGTAFSTYFALRAGHKAREAAASAELAEQEKRRASAKAAEAIANAELAGQEKIRAEANAAEANEQRTQAQAAVEAEIAARLRTEYLLYVSQIGLAQRDWEVGNTEFAWENLNACRPDLRGWEYDYLKTLFTKGHQTIVDKGSQIECVAFSPDGRRIVSGAHYRTLMVWEAATGKQLLTLSGHTDTINSVAYSPDGRSIVSGSYDNTVKVWDAVSGKLRLNLEGHSSSVEGVTFSSDGQRIVSGSRDGDNTAKVWNAQTGAAMLTLTNQKGLLTSVAFSPDGRQIIGGSQDHTVIIWNATAGKVTRTLTGHTDKVESVAFSPDGRQIASGSDDRTVKIWDAASGKERMTLRGHPGSVRSVAFSPDGRRIVSAGGYRDKTVKVWDIASGQQRLTLRGHTSAVNCVIFSPDGRLIASGSSDDKIKVWDAVLGQDPLTLRGHASGISEAVFSSDGRWIVSGCYVDSVKMWDAATGLETRALRPAGQKKPHSAHVAISPDGQWIASDSDNDTVEMWDAATGQSVRTLKVHSDDNAFITSVAFSPDSQRIASGSHHGKITIWDVATGQENLTLKGSWLDASKVVFSPDGGRIVTTGGEIWDAANGRQLLKLKGHSDRICSVAFSADGRRIVSGSQDKTIKVWDAENGKQLLTLKGHDSSVSSVAFSPDGRRIVSGSGDGLKLWDAANGTQMLTLKGHDDGVSSVAFSSDGRRIVSGGADKTIKVWDTTTSEKGPLRADGTP